MPIDTNRVRVAYVAESTYATTPAISATVPVRIARITGESLNFNIQNTRSNELRSDRQLPDIVQIAESSAGDLNFELSFPETRTFLGEFFSAAMFSSWLDAPEIANWATADSNVTDAGTTASTYAVAAGGASFIAGHMVRASGFTNAANNQLFRVSSSTATTVVGGTSLTAETAPPVGARLKVVGWRGATADLSLTVTGLPANAQVGLVSATQDWTLVSGLRVGSTVKLSGFTDVAGTIAGGNNVWARVVAIGGASNRTLYLAECQPPSGYSGAFTPVAEVGTGKTVTAWFGDVLRNGVTPSSFSIEKAFLGQAVPNYVVYKGEEVGGMSLKFESGAIATGTINLMGASATMSTTPLATTFPNLVPASTWDVLNSVRSVARIAENGSVLSAGNGLVRSMSINIGNNLREQPAVGQANLAGVGAGYFDVTGEIQAYFDSGTYYTRYLNGTVTSLGLRLQEQTSNRAIVITLPAVEYTSGNVTAPQANQDVMCTLQFTAKRDTLTDCMIQIERIEEWA